MHTDANQGTHMTHIKLGLINEHYLNYMLHIYLNDKNKWKRETERESDWKRYIQKETKRKRERERERGYKREKEFVCLCSLVPYTSSPRKERLASSDLKCSVATVFTALSKI